MRTDVVFVLIQFVLFALYFINFDLFGFALIHPHWVDYLVLIIGFCGALIISFGIINLDDNLTPFPTPKKRSSLISGGIYKYIRHPIYSGILICFAAYAIYSESIERILITIVLGIVLYMKSTYEERLLEEKFPNYESYKRATGRFFPKKKKK